MLPIIGWPKRQLWSKLYRRYGKFFWIVRGSNSNQTRFIRSACKINWRLHAPVIWPRSRKTVHDRAFASLQIDCWPKTTSSLCSRHWNLSRPTSWRSNAVATAHVAAGRWAHKITKKKPANKNKMYYYPTQVAIWNVDHKNLDLMNASGRCACDIIGNIHISNAFCIELKLQELSKLILMLNF